MHYYRWKYLAMARIKDVHALYKKLYEACKKNIAYSPDDHMYVAFGHLTGYGAKYYGYMWSKVFALDLFYEIKKHGLLDPVIGAQICSGCSR